MVRLGLSLAFQDSQVETVNTLLEFTEMEVKLTQEEKRTKVRIFQDVVTEKIRAGSSCDDVDTFFTSSANIEIFRHRSKNFLKISFEHVDLDIRNYVLLNVVEAGYPPKTLSGTCFVDIGASVQEKNTNHVVILVLDAIETNGSEILIQLVLSFLIILIS